VRRVFGIEVELGAVVVRWLRVDMGWEVWQEVDGIYDFLALRNGLLWGVETKLRFGAAVLTQAWQRRHRHVYFVSVAMSDARCGRATINGVQADICNTLYPRPIL